MLLAEKHISLALPKEFCISVLLCLAIGEYDKMSLDLVGLGSAIIDFAPSEAATHLSEVNSFIPYAGGSVSNILVAASKLGLKTGFIGCVGDDEFVPV